MNSIVIYNNFTLLRNLLFYILYVLREAGEGGACLVEAKNLSKDNYQQHLTYKQKHATATKHPFSRHTGKASGFGEDFLMPGLKKSWKKQML